MHKNNYILLLISFWYLGYASAARENTPVNIYAYTPKAYKEAKKIKFANITRLIQHGHRHPTLTQDQALIRDPVTGLCALYAFTREAVRDIFYLKEKEFKTWCQKRDQASARERLNAEKENRHFNDKHQDQPVLNPTSFWRPGVFLNQRNVNQ